MTFAAVWTVGRIEKVRELAAKGLSAREISLVIGTSKGSIIGICRRKAIQLLCASSSGKRPTIVERRKLIVEEDLRRADGKCITEGCSNNAARGYLHGKCPQCRSKDIMVGVTL